MKLLRYVCFMLLLALTLSFTGGAVETADLGRSGSITLTLVAGDTKKPVSGGSFTLYPVALLGLEDGNETLTFTEPFARCGLREDQLLDKLPAQALADYAAKQKLTGTRVELDADGTATFSNLTLGLYLVVQDTASKGYDTVKPFLVSVPQRADGKLIYDVNASPKVSAASPTPSTPPNKPGSPRLPQTGQLWWPVPVLAVLGLAFVAAGWKRRA